MMGAMCAGRGRDDENSARRPREPWDEGSALSLCVSMSLSLSLCLSICVSVRVCVHVGDVWACDRVQIRMLSVSENS